MTATVAQVAKSSYTDDGNSSNSVTVPAITTAASGSVFVILVQRQSTDAITISDSKSNTYTPLVNVDDTFGAFSVFTDIYVCVDGTGGASHTFTAASTGSFASVFVMEITGADLTAMASAITSAGQNDASSPFVDPGITVGAETLLIAFAAGDSGSDTAFDPTANSFTLSDAYTDGATYWTAATAYRYVTGAGTYNCSWTKSGAAEMNCLIFAAPSAASASADQEGARVRNDDGSETTATWAAAQDANYDGVDLDTNIRIRFLIDATDDLASTAFALEYKESGEGSYVTVPVGATSSPVAPVIEVGDCTEDGNNTATTSWAVDYPAYESGDLLVFHIASDANVTHNWPSTGPNGETINDIVDSTGGTAQRASGFWFVGSASTVAGNLTVTPSASEQWTSVVTKVLAGEFNASTPIQTNIGTANDTTADASWATPAWTADAVANGRVVCFAAHDTVTTSATPAGWSTLIARDRGACGCTLAARDAANTSAESIASASFTKTSETDSSFGYIINAPAVVTNRCHIATSANITAGGEATTAQLTAPSGKTTGDFVTGRMWDDENGTDSIDITADDYTEVEYCVQFPTAGGAANDEVYQFRVAGINSYTVTPTITINTGGAPLVGSVPIPRLQSKTMRHFLTR